jgi:hypothetical protein
VSDALLFPSPALSVAEGERVVVSARHVDLARAVARAASTGSAADCVFVFHGEWPVACELCGRELKPANWDECAGLIFPVLEISSQLADWDIEGGARFRIAEGGVAEVDTRAATTTHGKQEFDA